MITTGIYSIEYRRPCVAVMGELHEGDAEHIFSHARMIGALSFAHVLFDEPPDLVIDFVTIHSQAGQLLGPSVFSEDEVREIVANHIEPTEGGIEEKS